MSDQKYMAMGALRAVPYLPAFPLDIDHVDDVYDDRGIMDHFVIVTASGVRLKVTVEDEENGDGEETRADSAQEQGRAEV